MKTYFPIRIRMSETGHIKTVQEPEDLPAGVAFTVIGVSSKPDPEQSLFDSVFGEKDSLFSKVFGSSKPR